MRYTTENLWMVMTREGGRMRIYGPFRQATAMRYRNQLKARQGPKAWVRAIKISPLERSHLEQD